jgi:hypothetical protein
VPGGERMKALVLAWVAIVGAVGAAGCGGSASSGSSNCQAACNRCGGELCVDCAATSARFRDDFESAVYTCVLQGSDAACDTLWTSCAIQAEGQLTPRPLDTTYRDACLAKRSDCEAQGVSFADDDCLLSRLLEESMVAQAQQCLLLSCADIPACLRPIF